MFCILMLTIFFYHSHRHMWNFYFVTISGGFHFVCRASTSFRSCESIIKSIKDIFFCYLPFFSIYSIRYHLSYHALIPVSRLKHFPLFSLVFMSILISSCIISYLLSWFEHLLFFSTTMCMFSTFTWYFFLLICVYKVFFFRKKIKWFHTVSSNRHSVLLD